MILLRIHFIWGFPLSCCFVVICLSVNLWVHLMEFAVFHEYLYSSNLRNFEPFFFQIFSLLLFSLTPIMCMLVHLIMSHRSLRFCLFLLNLFPFCSSDYNHCPVFTYFFCLLISDFKSDFKSLSWTFHFSYFNFQLLNFFLVSF